MYKKSVLKNGLRVLSVPIERIPSVTVLVLVGTGSKYEDKSISGLSHFLEHMFFKGTEKYPSTFKLIEPLDRIGGSYNAFTSREYTGYYARVGEDNLDLAMDWVSDIYLNSLIKEEEIDRERGTILQELNMYLDTPMQYVGEIWMNLLYGDQPAGWDVIGNAETIKSITRNQFVEYLKNHYSAENTVVVVAGNVEHESVVKKVEDRFGGINDLTAKNKLAVIEKQEDPKSLVHYKKTDQTHLLVGFRGYNRTDQRRYALDMLATMLGGFMSSRLWISVRERLGLAYYIGTSIGADTDCGFLTTRSGVDNRKVEKAIEVILQEYKKMRDKKVDSQELEKAKGHEIGSIKLSLESPFFQASFVASQELLDKRIVDVKEELKKIKAVTVDDVYEVAQDVFSSKHLNLALIGPFKDKEKFDTILSSF